MDSHVIIRGISILFVICIFVMKLVRTKDLQEQDDEERGEHEKRLMYEIFKKKGYNHLIRPVPDSNVSLNIEFSLALSQIIDVDEKNQMMKTNVWLQVYWYDFQFAWDPVLFGNIRTIRLHPDMIWVPDFVLFNNADGNFEVTYKSNTVISHSTLVYWIPPAIYKSSCSIDVKYFPFDQQICEMKFGSWTHKGKALTYSFYNGMKKLDLGDYLKSGSWDIIDCPGKIVTLRDLDKNGVVIEKEIIVFKFILRRKTLFYTVNLIIPCVLISFVSVCVFALPTDAGEKITMCISVLLALVVFLLLVSKILPPSLTIPLIAKYLLFTFIMNLIAIFSTVVIINRNYRTPRTHQMPHWIRVVFIRKLPKFLFMTRPDHEERWQGKPPSPPSSTSDVARDNINLSKSNDFLELTEVHHPHCRLNTPSSTKKDSNGGHSNSSSQSHLHRDVSKTSPIRQGSPDYSGQLTMTPELYQTIDSIKFIYQHLKSEEEYEVILEDWKYVARVLDRLLLVIFLLVTIAGTAGILLNAPHILEYVDQEQIIQNINGINERSAAISSNV